MVCLGDGPGDRFGVDADTVGIEAARDGLR